jgi:hypothetical protein
MMMPEIDKDIFFKGMPVLHMVQNFHYFLFFALVLYKFISLTLVI